MALFGIVHLEDEGNNITIYARPKGATPLEAPHTFHMRKNSDMFKQMYECAGSWKYWDVPMDRFTTDAKSPLHHEELIDFSLDNLVKNAIEIVTKAKLSNLYSTISHFTPEQMLLDNAKKVLGEVKIYKAYAITLENGDIVKSHDIYPLFANDEDDAYKVLLSLLQQLEGREITSDNIFSYQILYNGEIVKFT